MAQGLLKGVKERMEGEWRRIGWAREAATSRREEGPRGVEQLASLPE